MDLMPFPMYNQSMKQLLKFIQTFNDAIVAMLIIIYSLQDGRVLQAIVDSLEKGLVNFKLVTTAPGCFSQLLVSYPNRRNH
jgi:hypothetical protein